ncbi:MAG: hypothetical protein QOJ53_1880, partial [Sphingomonadales bacterium]|nr:hypothetical protein [Sphingomonadales bacterium]
MPRFVEWVRQHPILRFWVPAVILVIGIPAWLLNASSPFQTPLSSIAVDKTGALEAWFIALIVGMMVLLICSAIGCVAFASSLYKTRKAVAATPLSPNRGQREFEHFTANLRSVIQRFDRRPNCETEIFKAEIRIFENGDVAYKRTHALRANNQKTAFHVVYEEADATAPAALYFSQTGLAIKSLDAGTDAILLPTENTTHRKEFAICFIPPLSKGQVRNIEISHTWPGYCSDLVKSGRTNFYWQNMTVELAGTMDACVELKFPSTWKNVVCRNVGASSAKAHLVSTPSFYDGIVWTLRDPELPTC